MKNQITALKTSIQQRFAVELIKLPKVWAVQYGCERLLAMHLPCAHDYLWPWIFVRVE